MAISDLFMNIKNNGTRMSAASLVDTERLPLIRDGEEFLIGDRVNIARIQAYDSAYKPHGFDGDIGTLVSLFEDGAQARRAVSVYLQHLGLGLKGANSTPLGFGGLEYVIDRLAARYDHPPSRALARTMDTEVLLDEESPQARQMARFYEDHAIDSQLQTLDRYSVLCQSVFIRVYPTQDGLRLRVFTPDNVMRVPHPQLSDEVEHDYAVVLKLHHGMYEVHVRGAAGRRTGFMADNDGNLVDPIPYEQYGDIPLIVRFDALPTVGRAWLQPRLSRIAYTLALGGLQADLQAMTVNQAHALLLMLTRNSDAKPPDTAGPNTVIQMDQDDDLRYINAQPAINETVAVMRSLLEMFFLGERIPAEEASGGTRATGAALQTLERALTARRNQSRPLAARMERKLWRIFQVLGRVHQLGDFSGEETDLRVTLSRADNPEDASTILDNGAKAMALGITGPVALAQKLNGVNRAEAINIIEQAQADQEEWPPPVQRNAAQVDQGDAADVVGAAGGEESADSVVDAATGRTASDAREERRQNDERQETTAS